MDFLTNLGASPRAAFILLFPFLASIVYVLGVTIYRLYFHPLAQYPGPTLAKVTDLYFTYHAWKGDRHLEFWRCHEKYGKVVRWGPNKISINSAAALKDIYGHKTNTRKSTFYSAFPPTKDTYNTHSSIDKVSHARKRRVLSQAFSDNAIRSMEKYIISEVRTFCDNLGFSLSDSSEKGWTSPKNISDQANYLTFDVMGSLAFGKAFGMLSSHPENRFAIDLVNSAAHRHLICGSFLPIHEWHLDKILFRQIAAKRQRYMQYSKAQAAERTQAGLETDRHDFFYHLLKARDPETGKGFSTAELWGESNLLIIAGSDTTSTALTGAFFYLLHNPTALAKLTTEVRAAFADVEEIRHGPALSSLPYLRACLDEAMRMSPPVPGVLPREVLPGGMEIDGLAVPAGTVVGTPHYVLHHNETYYPNSFQYKPERWIAGSEPGVDDKSVAAAHAAFCAFSIGSRGCIGKGMSNYPLPL